MLKKIKKEIKKKMIKIKKMEVKILEEMNHGDNVLKHLILLIVLIHIVNQHSKQKENNQDVILIHVTCVALLVIKFSVQINL